MVTRVILPKAGQTVEEATIVTWLKRPGEPVERGEVVLEVSTDKATLEVEAPASGVLLAVLHAEGETLPVLTPIGLIGEPGEDVQAVITSIEAEARTAGPSAGSTADARAARPVAAGEAVTEKREPTGRPLASPRAARLAKESGVDLATVRGTGPGGRITEADVKAAASPARAPARGRPLSRARKAVASAMAYSKQHIPHFYLKLTARAERLLALREELRSGFDLTLNDLVVASVARTMAEFPRFRSRLEGEEVVQFEGANVGVAVATDAGLLVPVVTGADGLSLEALAARLHQVTQDARAGKVHAGGEATLTVSNLGPAGVEEFQAIINPPECAILAVGAVREDVVVRDGQPVAAKVMTLVLSADHRLIDGVEAARFLARLKSFLEAPESLVGTED
jgi:pyruvate dehydrogenase E2 component (dihydrolipoamide acetyltransferase)